MALKATIFKAQLQLADMDRNVYADPSMTIARHPSEADERMMIRVLAMALNWPADTSEGTLELAKDMWEPDEPALWHKSFSDEIMHWVEVGQPDDKRIMKACGRARKVIQPVDFAAVDVALHFQRVTVGEGLQQALLIGGESHA